MTSMSTKETASAKKQNDGNRPPHTSDDAIPDLCALFPNASFPEKPGGTIKMNTFLCLTRAAKETRTRTLFVLREFALEDILETVHRRVNILRLGIVSEPLSRELQIRHRFPHHPPLMVMRFADEFELQRCCLPPGIARKNPRYRTDELLLDIPAEARRQRYIDPFDGQLHISHCICQPIIPQRLRFGSRDQCVRKVPSPKPGMTSAASRKSYKLL